MQTPGNFWETKRLASLISFHSFQMCLKAATGASCRNNPAPRAGNNGPGHETGIPGARKSGPGHQTGPARKFVALRAAARKGDQKSAVIRANRVRPITS
jgi:hypothetical protein